MKTLTKLVLSALMLTVAASVNAQTGPYAGSSDYVDRNPYAALPSVEVHDYLRRDGTYIQPHVRTSPNWTPTDNLSYRGYGTIRVPRSRSGW